MLRVLLVAGTDCEYKIAGIYPGTPRNLNAKSHGRVHQRNEMRSLDTRDRRRNDFRTRYTCVSPPPQPSGKRTGLARRKKLSAV